MNSLGATIIGAVIGGIVGGVVEKLTERVLEGLSKKSIWLRAGIIVAMVALGGIAGYLVWQEFQCWGEPTSIKIPKPGHEVYVTITSPQSGEEVSEVSWAKGTVAGLPRDWKLWMVVYSHDAGVWFPQEALSVLGDKDGEWEALIRIGKSSTLPGRRFDLAVVVADDKSASELKAHVGGCGVKMDAVFYARITVSRK